MSAEAVRHLKKRDKTLGRVIDRVGACALKKRRRFFPTLCHSIISQQISTQVAATINRRFCDLFDRRTPTPAGVRALDDGSFRGVGLSRQKTRYLRDLADKYGNGAMPHRRFSRMDDDAIIAALTRVQGIGVWTAQMFLIFVLNRPDVLPVGDFGVRKAAQRLYDLSELPGPAELTYLATPWRPYRSVASWYLWQSLKTTPLGAGRSGPPREKT